MQSEGGFETERLVVLPWDGTLSADDDDASTTGRVLSDELSKILDEEVTAFLPPFLLFQKGITDVSEWAKAFSKDSDVYAVRLSDGNDLAGVLLLKRKAKDDIHVGYIFGKAYWGRGLATELLRGMVQNMETNGYTGVLHAGVAHGNPASVKVLQKVGFEAVTGSSEVDNETDHFYRKFTR